MNRIELIVHGALLVIALGLAYGAWKADAPEERRSFTIFDPGAGGVEEVTWEDEKTVATVKIEGKGEAVRTWVTHGRRKPIPTKLDEPRPASQPANAPDAGPANADAGHVADAPASSRDAGAVAADAGKPEPPKAPTTSKADEPPKAPESAPTSEPADKKAQKIQYGKPQLRSFPGNDTSRQLVEALTPVKALRQFDSVDEETAKAMGMDEPQGTLALKTRAGKTLVFEVGETAYGTRSSYVRKKGESTIYLLGDDIVSMVRAADSRLMERRFWTFDEPDAVAIEVAASGAKVRLEQQARLSKGSSFWTLAGSEARSTEVEGFVEKLFDLRAQTYPAHGAAPKDTDLEVVMSATFALEGKRGVKIDLARGAGEPGKAKWYARTPLTRGWVTVRSSLAIDMTELLPKLSPAQ